MVLIIGTEKFILIEKEIKNPEALVLLEEIVEPRTDLPPLLIRLNERRAEQIDYIGLVILISFPFRFSFLTKKFNKIY